MLANHGKGLSGLLGVVPSVKTTLTLSVSRAKRGSSDLSAVPHSVDAILQINEPQSFDCVLNKKQCNYTKTNG